MAIKKKHKMVNVDFAPKLKGQLDFEKREFKFSDKQTEVLDCLLGDDTKIVFLSGVAGTSKTYLAVYAALHLLDKDYDRDILYIRTVQESGSKSLGYLPGDQDSKFGPFQMPLQDKVDEILLPHKSKELFASSKLQAIPVNFLRGASWKNKIVIIDESQNFCSKELTTALTRVGEGTKVFICGDQMQSDLPVGKSAFMDFIRVFDNEESREKGIFHFKFDTSDIVRSEILKFIIQKIESIPSPVK